MAKKPKRKKREASANEETALAEIREWKQPKGSWLDGPKRLATWAAGKAGSAIEAAPGGKSAMGAAKDAADWASDNVGPKIDYVVEKSVGGLISTLNDVALYSVREEAIYAAFIEAGHEVKTREDILKLDLEDVDRTIGRLSAKYKAIAAAEGGAAGVAGVMAIPPDVVFVVGLCQRAIGEYATYTGFDVSLQHERLYALNVLGLSSSPSDTAKLVAMAQLVRISQDVARKTAWRELEEQLFVQIVKRIATSLGIRLTKAKLAQVVPVVGAAVGAGFNAYFVSKVCDAAYFLYRERFLAAKYGHEVIHAPVEPAADLNPDLGDSDES